MTMTVNIPVHSSFLVQIWKLVSATELQIKKVIAIFFISQF